MNASLPTHPLPDAINADTMVIRSARGVWRHVIDVVLTGLAWVTFIYFFARGIWSIALGGNVGMDMPLLSQISATLSDISVYVLAMLLQGLVLIIWARYNAWRFRGKQRRAKASSISSNATQAFYRLDASSLQELRQAPISVIHHTDEGYIAKLEHRSTTTMLIPTQLHI